MADFGELCPLFNTGVFNEITFPNIAMTNVSATSNALDHIVLASSLGDFTFGRTVVVTNCWVRQFVGNSATSFIIELQHKTSRLAVGTVFGSMSLGITHTGMGVGYTWVGMTIATGATFTSSEVLGIATASATGSTAGNYDFIVRYKDK